MLLPKSSMEIIHWWDRINLEVFKLVKVYMYPNFQELYINHIKLQIHRKCSEWDWFKSFHMKELDITLNYKIKQANNCIPNWWKKQKTGKRVHELVFIKVIKFLWISNKLISLLNFQIVNRQEVTIGNWKKNHNYLLIFALSPVENISCMFIILFVFSM